MTLQGLLQKAIKAGASDLHLAVGHRPILRVDGELVILERDKVCGKDLVSEMISGILTDAQKKRIHEDGDADFAYGIKEQRFRINVHKESGNLSLAARVIQGEIPTMDTIGLLPVVQDLVNLRNGLVLVTGPAGTGKSTTLASMINAINLSKRVHIVTLEDPIEFVYPKAMSLVKQREVGFDIQSFAGGLRHVLRQDPDVIMVGEVRDLESVAATITLAETGHLAFSTLHTSSAPETIQRIIDMFPASQQDQIRSQLALSLRAVIAQTLLPAIKDGRVAAREIMVNTPAIANLIRENKVEQIQNVIQTNAKQGMNSLKQDVNRLVKEKKINAETAQPYLDE